MIDTHTTKITLETELASVTKSLEDIAQYEPETGDWVVKPDSELSEADPNSEADAFETTEEKQSTLALLETTYRNIIRALEKIRTDSYGACEICDAPIETARLEFLPTARTCTAHRDDERTLPL